MTPKEFRKELKALRLSIGPDAWVSAGINSVEWSAERDATLECSVHPHGLTRSTGSFHLYAEEWEPLLTAVKAKWAEYQAEYGKQTTRKIALAIIRITADLGQCTDAALRDEFTPALIKMYGKDAVADANKIAANGPFEIVKTHGANGAPENIEVREPGRVQ